MDRREAIQELKQWRDQMKSHGVPDYGKKLIALDLAIEALKDDTHSPMWVEMATGTRELSLEEWQEIDRAIQGDAESATTTDCISRADTINAMCRECQMAKKGVWSVNQKQITGMLESAEIATSEDDESTISQPKSKLESDLISRQAAIELACWRCKKCEKKDCEYKDSCETMRLLDALPSEDPKPPMLNNDLISRQDVIEAVRSATVWKRSLGRGDILDILYSVPSAEQVTGKLNNPDDSLLTEDSEACKEQKSKLDCISRQDAIEAMQKIVPYVIDKDTGQWGILVNKADVITELSALPPITPTNRVQQADTLIIATALRAFAQDSERNISDRERAEELREQVLAYGASMCQPPTERTGEWVKEVMASTGGGSYETSRCSECNWLTSFESAWCPNCGAKMGGDTEYERSVDQLEHDILYEPAFNPEDGSM